MAKDPKEMPGSDVGKETGKPGDYGKQGGDGGKQGGDGGKQGGMPEKKEWEQPEKKPVGGEER